MRLPSVFAPGPRLRIFAAITIASAAVISFESLKHLAEYAGFGHFAWLFPATLDAVAAFGMDLWVTRSPAWKQARALALAAIGGSLIGNIADHWISQGTVLPAVLGAVPPGMLAALLAVLHKHASGTASGRSGPDTAVRDAVWSTLPQAAPFRTARTVGTGPASYMVPDRIWSVDRSAPFEGPAVGPLLRDRAAVQRRAVREVQDGVIPMPVRRTSPTPRQVRSAGPADDVIVKAILDHAVQHGSFPSKRVVMTEYGVGSGRALKLISLAKAPEETHG
jgi:hypothetical protein